MVAKRRPICAPRNVLYVSAAAFCLALLAAACSGGGGGASSVVNAPHGAPASVATTVPFASAGTPMPLPPIGGFQEFLTLTENSEQQFSNVLNVVVSTGVPEGLPSPSAIVEKRAGIAGRARRVRGFALSPAPNDELLFLALSSNVTVTMGIPSLSVTVPSSIDTTMQSFYLAIYDPSNPASGWQTISIMGVNGQTLSFASLGPVFTLFANTNYGIMIYGVTTPTPPPVDALYASNYEVPSVTEYAPGANGNVTPVSDIAGGNTSLYTPFTIALDQAGEMFDDNSNYVVVFPPGSNGDVFPIRTIGGSLTGMTQSRGIAVDSAGDLYFANTSVTQSILYFAAGANGDVAPTSEIAGPDTGLSDPLALALDAQGYLYVANDGSHIEVFSPGSSGDAMPVRDVSLIPYISGALGVAVDASGYLYVSGDETIVVYPPGANGNATPSRVISGALTQLTQNDSLAVDSVGYVYSANSDSSSVEVFAPGASGDVAPVRTIAGSATQLAQPEALLVTPYFQVPSPP